MDANCPKDGIALAAKERFGFSALACSRCGGLWLPDASVQQALAKGSGESGDPDRFFEQLRDQGSATKRACCGCGAAMASMALQGVEVDACAACRGIWFDGDELRRFLGGRASIGTGVATAAGVGMLGAAGAAAAMGDPQRQQQRQNTDSSWDASDTLDLLGDAVSGIFNLLD